MAGATGMSVAVAANATGAPAGTIGWSGGFGSKWQSDPADGLTTILLTQCMFGHSSTSGGRKHVVQPGRPGHKTGPP